MDDYLYERHVSVENIPNYTLEAYLILPVQRIPRYELLLKDLLKHTSKYHRDYEFLEKSVKEIKQVATFVNEKLNFFKDFEKMRELSRTIKEKPKDFVFFLF